MPSPALLRVVAALVLGWGAAARAQSLALSEDFEGTNPFEQLRPLMPWGAGTLALHPEAAHSGRAGLRLVDAFGMATAGHDGAVVRDVSPTVAGTAYLRTWLRLTAREAPGPLTLASFANASGQLLFDVNLRAESLELQVGGNVVVAGEPDYSKSTTTYVWDVGSWHLLELELAGVTTPGGARRLWVDGALVLEATGLDLGRGMPDWRLARVAVGEAYNSNRSFRGTVDFDAVRTSDAPHPSTWTWAGLPPQATSGACHAFSLSVAHSGSLTRSLAAPAALAAQLTASSSVDFFSDALCASPADALVLPAGALEVAGSLRARTSGPVELVARTQDLLPGRAALEVTGPLARVAVSAPEVDPGLPLVLDGAASAPAPGQSLVRFAWRQVEGPEGLELGTSAQVTVTPREPGRYGFELVVSDSAGGTSAPTRAEARVRGEVPSREAPLRGCASAGGGAGTPALLALLGSLAAQRAYLFIRRRR